MIVPPRTKHSACFGVLVGSAPGGDASTPMPKTKLTALLIAATLLAAGAVGATPAFASHNETVFFEAPRDLLGASAATQAKTLAKLISDSDPGAMKMAAE